MTRLLPLLMTAGLCLHLCCLASADEERFKKELGELQKKGNYDGKLKAIRYMARHRTKEAIKVLRDTLLVPFPGQRDEAIKALSTIKDGELLALMYKMASGDKKPGVRSGMVAALRMAGDTSDGAVAVYERALADRDAEVRSQAARAIGEHAIEACKDALAKRIKDSDPVAGGDKLAAAAALGAKELVDVIDKRCGGGPPLLRAEALQALAVLDVEKLAARLDKAVSNSSAEVRMGAAYAIAKVASDVGFASAQKLIGDKDWRVQVVTIDALVAWHEKRCVTELVNQFTKEKGRLRYDLSLALSHMTGRDYGYDAKLWKNWWDASGATFEMPPKPKSPKRAKIQIGGGGADAAKGSVATFFGLPILTDAGVFAIDFSGSMRKDLDAESGPYAKKKITRLGAAFSELEKCLSQYSKDQRFSGVNISTKAVEMKKRYLSRVLVRATRTNRVRLLDAFKDVDKTLGRFQEGRGDMFDALVDATDNIRDTDTIILLSDGGPSAGRHISRETFVPEWRRYNKYRRVMLFTILVDDTGWRRLMQDLAEETHGFFLNVTAEPKKKKSGRKTD